MRRRKVAGGDPVSRILYHGKGKIVPRAGGKLSPDRGADDDFERVSRQTEVSELTTRCQEHPLYDDSGVDA